MIADLKFQCGKTKRRDTSSNLDSKWGLSRLRFVLRTSRLNNCTGLMSNYTFRDVYVNVKSDLFTRAHSALRGYWERTIDTLDC